MTNSLWIRTTLIIIWLLILIGVWYFNLPYGNVINVLLMLGSIGVAIVGSHLDNKEKSK